MELTFTSTSDGLTASYRFGFQEPSLQAPDWIMSRFLLITVKETNVGPIPVLGYYLGPDGVTPVNVAHGICFGPSLVSDQKYVTITLRPVASFHREHYLLSAIFNDGQDEARCIFERTLRIPNCDWGVASMSTEKRESVADILEEAETTLDTMGNWWVDPATTLPC